VYRLLEVIETGAGGADAIVATEWINKSQLRRFKHSANSGPQPAIRLAMGSRPHSHQPMP
jgi:hypothetical protein